MESILAEAPLVVPKPAATVYPTLKESWAFLGWFLLSCVVMGLPMGLLLALTNTSSSAYILPFALLINVVLLAFLRWKAGPRWPSLQIVGRERTWVYVVLPVVVLCLILLLSTLEWLHLPNWTSNTFKNAALTPVVTLLVGGVLAPVLEEVLFRGVLLQGLLRNYRPWVAIGQSALLFSIIHFNPAQSVPTFFMGLLLGWLFYRTRSLVLCMVIHILNNCLAFGVMIWSPRLEKMNSMTELFGSVGWYAAALVGAAAILGLFLWRIRQTNSVDEYYA